MPKNTNRSKKEGEKKFQRTWINKIIAIKSLNTRLTWTEFSAGRALTKKLTLAWNIEK